MLLEVGSRSGRYGVHIEPGSAARVVRAARRRRRAQAPLPRVEPDGLALSRARRSPASRPKNRSCIPDGERHKNLQTVGRVYDALIRAHADRASAIVAVGGGVLGDTAGFAAATYLRGVPVVQVPTTLLAQVDSAIGGKVGVNHAQGKNLIGAFHPPALVVVDPALLSTLPRREFRAGLYEVIKYGVIASRPLFDRVAASLPPLFKRDPDALMADRHRVVPHQGVGRRAGRARDGRAADAELRPHGRACARGGDQVPALPPRRSGGLRDAGRGGDRGRARDDAGGRSRRARGADRQDGTAAGGRRRAGRARRSTRSRTTRRSSPGSCTTCCRRRSATCEVVADVTKDEIAAALRGARA